MYILSEQKILGKAIKDYPKDKFNINNLHDLIEEEIKFSKKINDNHIDNGVRIINSESVRIGPDVFIDAGAIIGPNCTIEGKSKIGKNCIIEYSVIRDSCIGDNSIIGPFANIRPGTVLGENCKIGNFVEIKNSSIDYNSKVNHLSYIGDSDIGKNVNIGAGVITVNYDGKDKHKTEIGDNAFIGCNSNLVAPVNISDSAFIAAGSTITEDVPLNSLAIARAYQINKKNWKNKKEKI